MSLHAYQEETRRYESEVDAEAARLIREGVAPFDALTRAGQIVRSRRASVHRDKVFGKRGDVTEGESCS